MNRWCIIAGPRSGSVYVETMIYNSFSNQPSASKLGEFLTTKFGGNFHPTYVHDENQNLRVQWGIATSTVTDHEKFYQDRVSLIKWANKSQPLTLRVFCLDYNFTMDRYLDFFQILKTLDFQFLSLERNLFDQAISFYFMLKYERAHRFIDRNNKVTNNIDHPLLLNPVIVDTTDFIKIYYELLSTDNNRKRATEILNCPIILYKHAYHDLINQGIPASTKVSTIRTYDKTYREMVSNYQELIDLVSYQT